MKVLAWPLGAPWWRLLACLLVAVVALALAPEVLAQAGGAVNTNFPYLGPDPQKAMSAYTIFGLQYKLFLAPLSGQGAVEGLYYLSLLATMVGALLIVFNQKFRAPSTLGAWLILVVIMLFAPFNSRLLFYPIDRPAGSTFVDTAARFAPVRSAAASTGGAVSDCSIVKPCGFTPQLLGIHVASILHVAFSSLFSSDEWRGLVGNMRAEARARQDPAFNVGESWLTKFDEFVRRNCSREQLVGNTVPSPPAAVASPAAAPRIVTLNQAFEELNRFYSTEDQRYLPDYILLPNQEQILRNWPIPQHRDIVDQYLNGIKRLLELSENDDLNGNVKLSTDVIGVGDITIDAALNRIDQSRTFADTVELGSLIEILPAFFIYPTSANPSIPQATLRSRESLRRCYPLASNANMNSVARRQFQDCISRGGPMVNPEVHRRDFKRVYEALTLTGPLSPQSLANSNDWMRFIAAYRSNDSSLRNMPVLLRSFSSPEFRYSPAGRITSTQEAVRQVNEGDFCVDESRRLKQTMMDSIRRSILSDAANTQNIFDNLSTWILSATAQVPAQITVSGTTTGLSSVGYPPSSRAGSLNHFMTTYFQDLLLDRARQEGLAQGLATFTPANLSNEIKREVVVLGMIDVVRQATAGDRQRSEAERSAVSRLSPQLTGFGSAATAERERGEVAESSLSVGRIVADGFRRLSTIIGQTAIWVVSWFYGLIALSYWDFLNMFMDLAFMGLVVATPFLFLAGLIIPSNAPGVIMISILGVFILKFTAVSMVLLNALGMLMYNLIDAGAIAESWTTKATLVIAMSGLYTGIIAFSLYLMFKVGDANMFVSKLAALDDAAKEAAKTGVAAATAVMTAALGIAGAGVVGAFSTKAGGMAAMKKAAGSMATGAARQAGAGAVVDAMRDGGSGGPTAPGGPNGGSGGPDGQALTEAEQKELRKLRETTPFDESFTFKGETYKNYDGVGFKSAREIDGLMQKGSIGHLGGDSYYNRVDGKLNGSDLALDAELEGLGIEADAGQVVTKADGSRYKVIKNSDGSVRSFLAMARDAALTDAPEDMGPDVQQDVLDQMAKDKGQRFFEVDGQWYEVVPGEAGKFSIKESDQAVAAAARANGTDQFAPGTAPAAAAPSGANGAPAQPAPAIGTPPAAPGGTPATGAPPATTPPTAAPLSRQEQVLQDRREERQLQEYRDFADRQIDNEKAIDVLKAKANRSAPEEKELKAREEWRDAAQKADLIGSMAGNFNKGKELDALWDKVKKGGFEQPGFLAGGLSGLVGGARAFMGGASNIPVVGGIIKELVNEVTEAPERARAWQVSGGYREAMKLQKDAKRGATFRSELGATTGGYEYRDMMSSGSFQAQHDIAKSAAAQAVARQRSEWEALMYANGNQSFTVQQLQGIGRDDALMKVQSVRLEAKQMQEGTFMTKVLDAKGNIVDQEVKLSVGVLNDFAETAAWKGAAKKLGEGLTQQYGTIEKRYFRGPNSDWAKANRLKGTDRLSRFVTVDADTDYLQYGHINMVEGKWSHLAAKGKYDAYKTLRMNEMIEVEQHAKTNIASLIASVNETAEKKGKPELKIPVGLSFAEIARNPSQKAAIMAEATSAMKDAKIALPLSDFQYRAERVSYREVMQKSMRNQRQLRILEKENQETIMKDSVKESMIRVKMDDNVKRVTRGTNLFGRRFEISEGPESINEKAYYSAIDRIAGSDIKKRGDDKTIQLATLAMSKFNAIFNDVASLSSVDVIAERKISDNLFVQVAKAKELGETLVKFVEQERLDDNQRNALFRAYNLKDSDYDRAKNNLIPDNEMVEISERWSFLEGKNKKNKK